jgi:hypothetical protein
MAKMSARGAHKVVGYVYDVTDAEQRARGERMELTYALRSDGKVLRKIDFIYPPGNYAGARSYRQAGGYSIYGAVKDKANIRAGFERFIAKVTAKRGDPIRTARI